MRPGDGSTLTGDHGVCDMFQREPDAVAVDRTWSAKGGSTRGVPRGLAGALLVCCGLVTGASGQSFKPVLAADLNPTTLSSQGSSPGGPFGQGGSAALGSGTVFSAFDREHGNELWYTDGTPGGTRLVKDIQVGSRSSTPTWMATLGNEVIFVASTDELGTELWKTDGTPEGTVLVKELAAAGGSIVPQYCATAGSYVYFVTASNLQLWRTDGSDAGTIPLTVAYANVTEIEPVGHKIYFPAATAAEGSELWVSDGTVEGTKLVKDIVPGTSSSSIRGMFAAGDKLVFFPYHPDYGNEPWVSDGTAAGTKLAKDIYPGVYSNYVDAASIADGKVYFGADSPATGAELWVCDGTPEGTKVAADVVPGPDSSYVSQVAASTAGVLFQAEENGVRNAYFLGSSGVVRLTDYSYSDNFYMSATAAQGDLAYFFSSRPVDYPNYSLWSTDGTTVGTELVDNQLRYVNLLVSPLGNRALMNLDDGIIGSEPWVTDGTAAGTSLLRDINTGMGDSTPHPYVQASGRLVLVADDGVHGREPWVVNADGSTSIIADYSTGGLSTTVSDVVEFGDRAVMFRNAGSLGVEPWITDGTAGGTSLIKDVESGATSSYSENYSNALPETIVASGCVYYVDLGANGGRRNELVATDGTPGGTYFIDINTKANSSSLSGGINGAALGRSLIFAADDGTRGAELWRSDGTPGGTWLLKEFIAGTAGGLSLIENRFITFGSVVLFGATDNVIGSELYKSDGTPGGTVLVKDIRPGSQGAQPNPIANLGNKVILLATTSAEGRELWVTDGTAGGTTFLSDTNPGSGSASMIDRPLVSGGKAFMAISTSATGRELWVSDGTPGGTHVVTDLRSGPIGALASGRLLAAAGGRVYFSADDGIHGLELWMSDGTVEGTRMVGDIWPGLPGASPSFAAVLGSTLYFDAYRPEEGDELWSVKVCPADFDNSGFIDRDDFDLFVEAFAGGGDDADFDGSGFVDETDFSTFVDAFETGC